MLLIFFNYARRRNKQRRNTINTTVARPSLTQRRLSREVLLKEIHAQRNYGDLVGNALEHAVAEHEANVLS
jgi:hypothetical protein